MLNQPHFYHRTMRRCVVAFGSIFNDITMITYEKDTYNEIERIVVPLSYAGKEDFLTRLLANPDLHNPTQIVLPRMSFQMVGISYDPSRKISAYKNVFNKVAGDNTSVDVQRVGTPYDLDFEVNLYIRNVEDGTQIIEQILPFFSPDYTLTMNFIENMDVAMNVPVILKNIQYNQDYQGAADSATRILTWTLQFKMKTYFFGPVSTGKIIRKTTANTYIYNDSPSDVLYLSMAPGFGSFQLGEQIYQGGTSVADANSSAVVSGWDATSNTLTITGMTSGFVANANVVGVLSGASYSVLGVTPQNGLVDTIVVTPNPPTANGPPEDFGFTTINTEY